MSPEVGYTFGAFGAPVIDGDQLKGVPFIMAVEEMVKGLDRVEKIDRYGRRTLRFRIDDEALVWVQGKTGGRIIFGKKVERRLKKAGVV